MDETVADRTRRWQHPWMRIAIALAVLVGLAVVVEAKPRKPTTKSAPTAFAIVLDRSGSMKGEKLEEAKKAVLAAAKALSASDRIALVTFDSEARIVLPAKTRADDKAIAPRVAGVEAGGGTSILPGLKEAYLELSGIVARKRVVLLLSDGEAPADGIPELVREMRAAGMIVSTVAVQGADEAMLRKISDDGGGRAYKIGDDLSKLSAVFVDEVKIARR